jgi:hypothetical protein
MNCEICGEPIVGESVPASPNPKMSSIHHADKLRRQKGGRLPLPPREARAHPKCAKKKAEEASRAASSWHLTAHEQTKLLMTQYRVLLDRDMLKTASLFPKKRTVIVTSEKATDRHIVKQACQDCCIIVTANGRDFRREIDRFLHQTKRNECHDLSGLVILPSGFEIQERLLKNLEDQMRYRGKSVSWFDVWDRSYCVRMKTGGAPEVTTLPRCSYCAKQEAVVR